jgi:hypothetical protein
MYSDVQDFNSSVISAKIRRLGASFQLALLLLFQHHILEVLARRVVTRGIRYTSLAIVRKIALHHRKGRIGERTLSSDLQGSLEIEWSYGVILKRPIPVEMN